MKSAKVGDIAWLDLTVGDAEQVKDFYQQVIGWQSEGVNMGDYHDYSMKRADSDDVVSGICHAKGPNAELPAVWLPYFLVADIEASIEQVTNLGGKLITPIKSFGNEKFAVIQDPAGASCALYQK